MDNTTSMQAQHKLSFLHHIRLVPLFSSILGGIILLFALSSGLAGYFLLRADNDQQDVTAEIRCAPVCQTVPTIYAPPVST